MSFKKVQLSGKCTLQIDTLKGSCKIEIPKVNKEGINNADSLIREVIHFGVMRHGKEELMKIISEKLSTYGDEFNHSGIKYQLNNE